MAHDDSATTGVDIPVSIDVLSNDTDSDGSIDVTSVAIVIPASNGTAISETDGTVTYTPNSGFIGADTFTYTVKDDDEATSNPAQVEVTVQPEGATVIIDNLDTSNTSSTGTWLESGGDGEWAGSSYWSRNGDTFSFIFNCPATGPYDVLEWHSTWSSRSNSVAVSIEHDGGPTQTFVNQRIGGNTWNLLGQFEFTQNEQYLVTITASNGTTVSTAADAMMFRPGPPPVPPTITTHPANQAVTVGNTAAFNVVATGTSLNYQWRKNGVNIAGGNSAAYTTPATTLADNGSTYDCVVSNTAGSVTSNAATLTVQALVVAPTITTHPANRTVTVGNTAAFNVVATGTSLNYQWRKNGGNIAGGNSAAYTTPATTLPDNGSTYDCVVSNTAGSVTSNAATLTVIELPVAPTITTHPANRTVTVGNTAAFNVVATGTSLNYQWRKNGVNITGGNSAAYTTPAATLADNGSTYVCVVSNTAGSVTSNAATLTVQALVVAPTITTHPANRTVTVGNTAAFNVVATGTSLNYQWRKNGVDIAGGNSAAYTTPATTLADNGSTYVCVVSNTAGSVTSNAATLTVEGSGQTVQHVWAFPIFDTDYYYFRVALQELGATQENQEIWHYTNSLGQEFVIHISQDDVGAMIEALTTQDSMVVMAGHSNYGIGHAPSNAEDNATGRIYGILYVDDPGLVKMSSPFFDGSVSGLRSHFDPNWKPEYQAGGSAIKPFGFYDPSGESPPYNFTASYKIAGDPTCYNAGIERMLPESDAPPWFDSNCGEPDPINPDHWKYFITTAVAYKEGNWATGAASGDYGSNYYYLPSGAGNNKVIWENHIRNAGDYVLYGWWPGSPQNTTSATFTLNQPDGSEIARFGNVDQTIGGGWVEIGQFTLTNPGPVGVFLTDAAAAPGNVVADAIQIVGPLEYLNVVAANFRASTVRFGPAPLTVRFSSQQTGLQVSEYEWDFNGDGVTDSTSSSPSYPFTQPGSYDVTLTVRDANGNEDSSTFPGYVYVGDSPASVYAEFSNSSPGGNYETVPATVTFTDRSVTNGSEIIRWRWDFDGDGVIDSKSKNPSFVYTTPGVYTVSLTVTDSLGFSDTKVKEKYVLAMGYVGIVDNNTSPTYHYPSKTILRRKGLPDVPADQLRYKKLYIHSCEGRYYMPQYTHGVVFYSLTPLSGWQGQIWLKDVLLNKSDYQIWQDLQASNPIFDYYDYSKLPWEQP